MASVTSRVKIGQPKGGYVPLNMFEEIRNLENISELKENGEISANLVGITVDYLSRFIIGNKWKKAFKISVMGARRICEFELAVSLLQKVNDLSDESITAATKLSGFDVCFRAGPAGYKPVQDICPNENDIFNIRTLVQRVTSFLTKYGPVVKMGFTFTDAYTSLITSGDGDFLTEDTLWDIKVTKAKPRTTDTLQILVYYLMGIRSTHIEFKNIKYIGIYNPKLNIGYRLKISDIAKETIEEVEKVVIGYTD